jgi:hypothetical protein
MSKILPKNIDVLVASYGGVGTTFLTNFISKYKRTNHPYDDDGFKHLPIPPISFNPNIRFVYVVGDPIMAVISLFRRNYHYMQSRKLQRFQTSSLSPIALNMSLKEYVSSEIDLLLLRSHFFNWYEKFLVHPTMFIQYERIWDNVEQLISFLELPKSSIKEFPEKKERCSNPNEQPQEVIRGLYKMYGAFIEELAILNDMEIKGWPPKKNNLYVLYSKNFRVYLRHSLIDDMKQYIVGNYPKLHKIIVKIKR